MSMFTETDFRDLKAQYRDMEEMKNILLAQVILMELYLSKACPALKELAEIYESKALLTLHLAAKELLETIKETTNE